MNIGLLIVIFKRLVRVGTFLFELAVGKSLAGKYAQRTEYAIELNLTVCTYVPLFKGESYYSNA